MAPLQASGVFLLAARFEELVALTHSSLVEGMKRNSDGETGPAPKRPRPMGDTELRLLVYSKVKIGASRMRP